MGEGVKREWILSEERDVEDCFWIWKMQASQVGIQPRVWRTKVWYSGRGADACSDLSSTMVSKWSSPPSTNLLTITTIFLARPSFMYWATDSIDLSLSI